MDSLNTQLEPNWIGWERLRHAQVPKGVYSWLYDRASLTARIKSACRCGAFRVRVVRQGWGKPLYSEESLLGMRHGEIAIVREVELLCSGKPWVFARTLIPASSLCGPARRLAHLGNRPLGEVLFSDQRARRGVTQVARLLPRHRLFVAAVAELEDPPAEIWGRRSLFRLSSKPLLVNEIFLPDIPKSPR
ncbi:MAG: chorismate lyase [Gammaproteobacteria bacterium]|nr:chorismate lyase [Gammaproteobacteria bacterium]MCP5406371.1 chorismate lyase [Chromatiaceae bacterium]MCP5408039.1 chorismate lyase [Chromatiaceae bacterium]MCP5442938.1 chorismate lyase [Chromatiaceae bacterium]